MVPESNRRLFPIIAALVFVGACSTPTPIPTLVPAPTLTAPLPLLPPASPTPAQALQSRPVTPPPPAMLVSDSSAWRYTTQPQPSSTRWYAEGFNDALWASAPLPLGTGKNARTRIGADDKTRTMYLRTSFDAANLADWKSLTLITEYRSGIAVYLNGLEIARAGLERKAESGDYALVEHDTPAEKFDVTFALIALGQGRNTLATEVHRHETEPDLFVSLELRVGLRTEVADFVMGPMLGLIGPDTVTFKAESDEPATGVVEYRAEGGITSTLTLLTTTNHRARLHDLKPGTTYEYRFGLKTKAGTNWSPPGRWTTDGGVGQSFRFGVWADSRPYSGSAMPIVFRQMLGWLEQRGPLALGIAVGDNVQTYEGPTDERTLRDRYLGYFDAVGPLVRQMPFYPILGNHDGSECKACLAAFSRNFLLPEQNDQTYYSFNYGPAHFVITNNEQKDGTIVERMSDEQWKWLTQDLAANKQPITLVFAHNAIFGGLRTRPRFAPEETNKLHELFQQSNVLAVFQGDSHYYNFLEQDGIAYVVTGGAGSPLYYQSYNRAWEKNEVLLVEVTPTQVKIQAIMPDGNVLDERTLSVKPRKP